VTGTIGYSVVQVVDNWSFGFAPDEIE
jgi:hypothetical protein